MACWNLADVSGLMMSDRFPQPLQANVMAPSRAFNK
jgi:hypothetical protein